MSSKIHICQGLRFLFEDGKYHGNTEVDLATLSEAIRESASIGDGLSFEMFERRRLGRVRIIVRYLPPELVTEFLTECELKDLAHLESSYAEAVKEYNAFLAEVCQDEL